MREHIKILLPEILRDEKIERRVLDYNRDEQALFMVLAGAVLVLVAYLW